MADTAHDLREQVRRNYAAAATAATRGNRIPLSSVDSSACCGPAKSACRDSGLTSAQIADLPSIDAGFGASLYSSAEHDELPAEALLASLGCGNPMVVAELHEGETVVDLGSGGGLDVLLSARRVGPSGFVYGVDMTDEMLELAESNRAKAGATNVEFLKGTIEDLPLPDDAVDVIISNCVINLSTDKPAVLAEMFRVLAPGGRIGISDVVAEDHLSPADRSERGSHVGCIAGALSQAEYRQGLADVGFSEIDVALTHEVAPGLHGALIRAVKPS